MYKFPITKNGIEYAVKIYKDCDILLDYYTVALYRKNKLFNITYNRRLKKSYYNINVDSINDGSYFITLAKDIVNKYVSELEEECAYQNGLIKSTNDFINWDGNVK